MSDCNWRRREWCASGDGGRRRGPSEPPCRVVDQRLGEGAESFPAVVAAENPERDRSRTVALARSDLFQIAEFSQFPEQPYRGRLGKFQFPDQFRRQHRMVLLGHIFEYPERFLKNLDHFSA